MPLTDIERGDESCKMTFSDGTEYHVEYLDLRLDCPCANCKPRRENKQRMIEFKEELSRLRIEKPSIEIVGHYGLKFIWPSGCSSGIYRFERIWALANNQDPDDGRSYVHGAW